MRERKVRKTNVLTVVIASATMQWYTLTLPLIQRSEYEKDFPDSHVLAHSQLGDQSAHRKRIFV
jgi:hypothetical protein